MTDGALLLEVRRLRVIAFLPAARRFLSLLKCPSARHRNEFVTVFRPIVQRLRIEVGSIWPLDRPERLV